MEQGQVVLYSLMGVVSNPDEVGGVGNQMTVPNPGVGICIFVIFKIAASPHRLNFVRIAPPPEMLLLEGINFHVDVVGYVPAARSVG